MELLDKKILTVTAVQSQIKKLTDQRNRLLAVAHRQLKALKKFNAAEDLLERCRTWFNNGIDWDAVCMRDEKDHNRVEFVELHRIINDYERETK